MMGVKISVVVITYNEEKNIGRCLESVIGIADDIVVVDSYSTDRTESICREKGARFIQHSFFSHIDQKNWAITQAKYPYILSLDADEVLSSKMRASVLKVKENWTSDGYIFNRLTNYCGKWIRYTTWYPSRKLRLWDSRKGKWGGINPHDKFKMEEGVEVSRLRGDILHYSYYEIAEHHAQLDKFSTIEAQSYYEMGIRSSFCKKWGHSIWRFLFNYIFRLGILSGREGYIISRLSAREVRLKYEKLEGLWRSLGSKGCK